MVGTDLAERVAALEARMDMDYEDRERRRAELDSTLQDVKASIDRQAREMERYRGVVGGISLAISILWAGVAFFKDAIVNMLGGAH